jgi:HD superfamily phosphohydrolase
MKADYRDNYYGSILDPLHGDIKLSEIEKWCISQPIFSRLRRVKQNTFLYYVFPSANHTRFEHSIGVMHLAGRIFDSCKENYATGQKKKEKYSIAGESSFFDLNLLGEREEIFYQELRLAALLHDLGHGPLSHLFDEFAVSKDSFLKIISGDENLNRYKSGFEKLIKANKGVVEHEIISCAYIFMLIHQLKQASINDPYKFSPSAKKIIDTIQAERIVKLVEPEFPDLFEFTDNKENNYTSFFSRIITAFPIDADRMDYLWRDSYFSGVTYGIYDINRIFSSFLASVADRIVFLTYKESGLDSMLRFIQSRSHLYNQVYFHKTNRAANTMLTYGTETNRAKQKKLLDSCQDLNELVGFYTKNSDEYFLTQTVRDEVASEESEKEIIDELINRKLFKRVYQAKVVLIESEFSEIEAIKKIKKNIDQKLLSLKKDGIFAVSDRYDNNTYKDSDKKPILIARKRSKKYDFENGWKNVGREFEMANMNVSMIRIYLRRNFSNSDQFEQQKDLVLQTVKEETEALKKYSC